MKMWQIIHSLQRAVGLEKRGKGRNWQRASWTLWKTRYLLSRHHIRDISMTYSGQRLNAQMKKIIGQEIPAIGFFGAMYFQSLSLPPPLKMKQSFFLNFPKLSIPITWYLQNSRRLLPLLLSKRLSHSQKKNNNYFYPNSFYFSSAAITITAIEVTDFFAWLSFWNLSSLEENIN